MIVLLRVLSFLGLSCRLLCISFLWILINMAASIQDAGMADALYNATTYASDTFSAEVQAASQLTLVSTLMNNKFAVAFALLAIFVVGKFMTGGDKLPKGVKPLPQLPGTDCPLPHTPGTPLTSCRPSVRRSFLGRP